MNTIRVLNGLNPDLDRRSIGPGLYPKRFVQKSTLSRNEFRALSRKGNKVCETCASKDGEQVVNATIPIYYE